MNTNVENIEVANFQIEIVRKAIKNMLLAVYPPDGKIRIAAPLNADGEVVRLFAISKLSWIKKQIKKFQEQARETPREYLSSESHYFFGKRYLLKLTQAQGPNKVVIKGIQTIEIITPEKPTPETAAKLLKAWYRKELKKRIPELLEKWEKIIGVKANEWGVKQMRTKWGSCNVADKRIWLNLELAKKPIVCLEYVIVHELVHLLERNHNAKYIAYLDQFMPNWRIYRDELNRLPIPH